MSAFDLQRTVRVAGDTTPSQQVPSRRDDHLCVTIWLCEIIVPFVWRRGGQNVI